MDMIFSIMTEKKGNQKETLKINTSKLRCAALNMSLALEYRSIVLLVPRGYRRRSQTRANAGAGNRKGWYVLNCPQKMTD